MSEITVLGRLLRSLCHNTKWDYAVFWKLKQTGEAILTWEEGCFRDTKESIGVEDALHDGSVPVNSPGIVYPSLAMEAQGAQPCSVKKALLKLCGHQYPLGEGIIGEVALTQRHHWILVDEAHSNMLSEYYEDWQLHLAAGIKTILLVPTRHFGVVQLGSLDMVNENSSSVIQIEQLFCELFHNLETCNILETSFDGLTTLPLNEHVPGNSSASMADYLNPTQSQQFFTMDPDMVFSPLEDVISQMFDPDTMYNNLLFGTTEASCLLDYSNNTFEDDISVTENETKICVQPNVPYCGSDPKQFLSQSDHEVHAAYDAFDAKEITLQEAKKEHNYAANSTMDSRLLGHDSRIHKVLGYATIEENDSSFSNTTVPKPEESVFSTTTFQTKESCEQSFDHVDAHLIEKSHAGYLLDAVVSSLQCPSTDDEIEEFISQSCKNSLNNLKESESTLGKRDFSILGLANSILARQSEGEEFATSSSSSKRICRSNCEDTDPTANKYTERKLSEITRRKDNISTAQKPRPRDRQLIQDRIKELRELIPNGSKCSIDELLYKTVRHMLFLQSISTQAKKLKESANSESTESKLYAANIFEWSSMRPQNCPPDNQSQEDCPLIFKNLHHPGQILVEMLCKDYAFFLDIAHTIRRLELVILTGALERRQHQGEQVVQWAHFIIEVPNGFNRVNILWPLMQLLQKNHAFVPNKL